MAAWLGLSSSSVADEVWFIDPERGIDADDRGRASNLPLRTVSRALQLSEEPNIRICLSAGTLRGGWVATEARPETFPLRVPAHVERLELVGASSGAEHARFETDAPDTAMIQFLPAGPGTGSRRSILIQGVEFVGAKNGLSIATDAIDKRGRTPDRLDVTIENTRFQGIRGTALQVFASSGWNVEAHIESCAFARCGSAMSFHVGDDAALSFTVLETRVEDSPALFPGEVLGAAAEVHVDGRSSVRGTFERNFFRNPATAFELSTAGPEADDSSMQVAIRNNVVFADPDASCGDRALDGGCGLAALASLSIWPHHDSRIELFNNTIVGVSLRAFDFPNHLDFDPEADSGLRIEARNNIFWERAPRDDGAELSTLWNGEGFLPVPGEFSHNLAPDRWGLEQRDASNRSEDPLFADAANLDFRITADSPARDSGFVSDPERSGMLDVFGNCRFAGDGVLPSEENGLLVDRGAHELDGLCGGPTVLFVRGDCDLDGEVAISDAVFYFTYLFAAGDEARPRCHDACDTNDDGVQDMTDGIISLGFLFLGTAAPASPFPHRGVDRTEDLLGCEASSGL